MGGGRAATCTRGSAGRWPTTSTATPKTGFPRMAGRALC